jgi:hypothetical protein
MIHNNNISRGFEGKKKKKKKKKKRERYISYV